ncbi:MAG: DUF1800 domain-containing protein, partial [Actinomycetota bacterium]
FLRSSAVGATALGSGVLPALLVATPASAAVGFVSKDRDLHLLRRATWGVTPSARERIRKLGPDRWLEEQLHPGSVNDAYCDDLIAERFPRLDWTIRKAHDTLDFGWDLMFDLGVSTIARACWSERQLLEVMVDLWSNHLNVTNPSDAGWDGRHDYDRTVIRKHALGKFSNMLRASASLPSMMVYLNNAESTKDSPNENYGRELLELHSVGVDGGYDETDMRNSTLVMTGFGYDWETGEFAYHDWAHYTGPVRIMDWSSKNRTANGGHKVGLDYVDYLAHHPSTATHIATKLVRRFVSDDPARGLVDRLAETYLDHDTDVVPVLRQLFRSKEFAGSIGKKIRRPMQDQVATMRVLRIGPDTSGNEGMYGLYWMLSELGDAPSAWHSPDGYADFADAWRSAGGSIGRWNMHMSLAAHWWPDQLRLPDLRKLLPKRLPATHGKLVDALARSLTFRTLSDDHRDAVLGFVGRSAGDPLSEDDEAVGWRLPYLVALILDSPYHEVR